MIYEIMNMLVNQSIAPLKVQICIVPIVPPKKKKKKKITIGIWVSITKEPFMESEKSNRIMKL